MFGSTEWPLSMNHLFILSYPDLFTTCSVVPRIIRHSDVQLFQSWTFSRGACQFLLAVVWQLVKISLPGHTTISNFVVTLHLTLTTQVQGLPHNPLSFSISVAWCVLGGFQGINPWQIAKFKTNCSVYQLAQ